MKKIQKGGLFLMVYVVLSYEYTPKGEFTITPTHFWCI